MRIQSQNRWRKTGSGRSLSAEIWSRDQDTVRTVSHSSMAVSDDALTTRSRKEKRNRDFSVGGSLFLTVLFFCLALVLYGFFPGANDLGIPEIIVSQRIHIVIQLIYQRNAGWDIQSCNVFIADVVQEFDKGPK